MGDWLETYRGTVFRWEVDHNDHFTVAYYFARIADAGLGMLADLGLSPLDTPTTDCFVRYQRELRVGDVMHVEIGVVHAEPGAIVLGHKLFDTGAATLCTWSSGCACRRAAARHRAAGRAPRCRERRPTSSRAATCDTVKPAELDVSGGAAPRTHPPLLGRQRPRHRLVRHDPAYARRAPRLRLSSSSSRTRGAARGLVRVRSGVLHVGSSSLRLLHVMTREPGGEVVASLEQSGVHFDQDARRPAPLPPPLRERALGLLRPTP